MHGHYINHSYVYNNERTPYIYFLLKSCPNKNEKETRKKQSVQPTLKYNAVIFSAYTNMEKTDLYMNQLCRGCDVFVINKFRFILLILQDHFIL